MVAARPVTPLVVGVIVLMLVEESRLFQVTFHTLDLHQSELDQGQVLADVTVIADELDFQLMQAVRCWETPVA
jgi:hypothetical protein